MFDHPQVVAKAQKLDNYLSNAPSGKPDNEFTPRSIARLDRS
jgi:hypothetical protein